MNWRGLLIVLAALPLGGCEWQTLKSSVAGSCAVFDRPPYAVRGKTTYDQNVADNFVESGVAGCNWKRPEARPPELDAMHGVKVVAKPVRKQSLVRRLKNRVWPKTGTAPVTPLPAPPIAPPPPAINLPAPAVPLPKPRSAIDELLFPSR